MSADETDIPIQLAEAEPESPKRTRAKRPAKKPGALEVTRDQWEKDFAGFYMSSHGALAALTQDETARISKQDAAYVAEPYGAIAERYGWLKYSGAFVIGTAISRTAEVEGRSSYPVLKERGLQGLLFGQRRKPRRAESEDEPDPVVSENGRRSAPAFRALPSAEEWAGMSPQQQEEYTQALKP